MQTDVLIVGGGPVAGGDPADARHPDKKMRFPARERGNLRQKQEKQERSIWQ
jgi:hypothetical protein